MRRVRIAVVELSADRHVSMVRSSTLLDAAKTRHANIARRCWQLQEEDGTPLYVGLFIGPEYAADFARARGWQPGGFSA